MTVTDLIEKLRHFPQELEVHIMADLERDLVDIASVHLITKPFSDEPFVVIEAEHHRVAIEDRCSEVQDPEDREDTASESGDSSSEPEQ